MADRAVPPDVSGYLQDILDAVYGEDVRTSIHHAIRDMNTQLSNAILNQLIQVDNTLTQSGYGADAKVVGDNSLMIKTDLPNNTELNTVITTGIYRLLPSYSFTADGEAVWKPVDEYGTEMANSAGFLIVIKNGSNVHQKLFYLNTSPKFRQRYAVRMCNTLNNPTPSWSQWAENIDTSLTVFGQAADAKSTGDRINEIRNNALNLGNERTNITMGANLNSYTDVGSYSVKSTSVTNLPEAAQGALYVISLTGTNNILQWYLAENGNQYTRAKIGSSWTTWTSGALSFTLAGHNDTKILANDDLNNYTTPGNFVVGSSTAAAAISNIPEATGGILKVLTGSASGNVMQFYITNSNYVYARAKDNSGWNEWKPLATRKEILEKAFSLAGHNDTKILANDDLDLYTMPGNFVVSTSSAAEAISHMPVTTGGILKVLTGSAAGNVIQIYISNSAIIYTRRKDNSGWTNWITLISIRDVDNEIKAIALTTAGHNDTKILANDDLDLYTTPGNFVISTSSAAADISNIPEATGGILKVFTGSSSGNVMQFYITNSNYIYARAKDNSGWNEWKPLATRKEILEKAFSLAGHNDTKILADDDLDNYATPGNFVITSSTAAAAISHMPVAAGGTLKVMTGSSSANVMQIYISNSATVYTRRKDNSGWTSWLTLISIRDVDNRIKASSFTLAGHNDTKILANDDFDNYITPGNYVVGSSSAAAAISNIPVSTGGMLKVVTGSSSGNVMQIYISNASYIYHRKKDNSGWSNWVYPEDQSRGSISSGDDFNDYTIPGWYRVQDGAIARTALNSPTGYPGILKVMYGSFDRYLTQVYYCNNSPEVFVRTMVQGTGTWTDWNDLSTPNVAVKSLSKVLKAVRDKVTYDLSFANALLPLNIKNYMGNTFNVHPKVLYFDNGFGGHKYWMAYTPYPFSDDNSENPCICYSDDGIEWTEIPGNPIDDPQGNGYNSDTHLVYRPDTGTLECWFRYVGDSSLQVREETIYRKTTQDGITWSEKELLQTNTSGNYAMYLSPAIEWDGSKYCIWAVGNGIEYYESSNGKNWTLVRSLASISFVDGETVVRPWHIDVIRSDGQFIILAMCRSSTNINTPVNLFIATSTDNITYNTPYKVIEGSTGWDQYMYRSSIVKCGNEYRIYYSAGAPNGTTFYSNAKWGIGLSTSQTLENFKGLY